MRSPDALVVAFRARGLKVTPQRHAVFRALHGNDAHPTAEAVHSTVVAEMPTVSLRTVYQTLADLAEMGELVALELGTGAARFDPNTAAHHHVVCVSCGLVRDVVVDDDAVRLPPAAAAGFEVSDTDIVFRGRCASCAAEPAPPT